MIEIATSMGQLAFGELMQVYQQSNREIGEAYWPDAPLSIRIANAEQEMYAYLREAFFPAGGVICCLRTDGKYVSALRLEPWKDGLLLTGLETARDYRNQGHAKALMLAVQEYVFQKGAFPLYSHIRKSNTGSIAVHKKCGFCKLQDHAVLLDGSVDPQYATYRYGK